MVGNRWTSIRYVIIRALRTMAQTAAGVIGTTGLLHEVDVRTLLSTTILAGIICVLMNIGEG